MHIASTVSSKGQMIQRSGQSLKTTIYYRRLPLTNIALKNQKYQPICLFFGSMFCKVFDYSRMPDEYVATAETMNNDQAMPDMADWIEWARCKADRYDSRVEVMDDI